MVLGRPRRPFLGSLDPSLDPEFLLAEGLAQVGEEKATLREALLRAGAATRVASPRPGKAAAQMPGKSRSAAPTSPVAPADEDENPVQNPTCEVHYDANQKLTTVVGRADVKRSLAEMATYLDPRSWGCGGGGVAAAYLVNEDHNGNYAPRRDLDHVDLGKLGDAWPTDQVLLWEYARSDVASFENILAIESFKVTQDMIRIDYHLYDCLVCTFGILSAPGGLTVDEGYILAEQRGNVVAVEVLKRIKVRDLTPHDPGNQYDFGQWVNSTIGAALSEWVNDTNLLSPVV